MRFVLYFLHTYFILRYPFYLTVIGTMEKLSTQTVIKIPFKTLINWFRVVF